MRIRMPITGTVKQLNPYIIGDDDNPIRMINIDLGNVSWKLVRLDLEDEEMEIEVKPAETVSKDTGKLDENNEPIGMVRKATSEEKAQFLEHARNHSLERMSKQALYALSKSPRLKNPFRRGR